MKKQKVINHYRKCLETMVSDVDFERFLGPDVKNKIFKYSELADVENLDDILPKERDYLILLTENKRNEGHWCCLMKYNNLFEWFDSYGGTKAGKPDGELSFISKAVKVMLGEDKHYLSRLLKKSGCKVIYNKEKFQSLSDGINTCGKWTLARLISFNCGFTLADFQTKVNESCEKTGKPPDIIVCDWIV